MSADVEIVENCQLEWHKSRGVLYVHNKDTGATLVRICGLKRDDDLGMLHHGQLDITRPQHVTYPKE